MNAVPRPLPSPTPEQPLRSITPLEWTMALYGGRVSTGTIELRLLPSRKSLWISWPSLAGRANEVKQFPQKQNVYYGIALRKDSSSGAASNLVNTHLLWQDLDLKDTAGYLPEGQDVLQMTPEALMQAKQQQYGDLMRLCANYQLPPLAVVNSGHGLQVLWQRKDSTAPEKTKGLNLALWELFKVLGSDRKTAEPARIFRLPGSLNLKNPERPLPVEIWHLDPLQIVETEALASLIPQPIPRPAAQPLKRPSPPVQRVGHQANTRADTRRRAEVAAAVRGETKKVAEAPEGERNKTLHTSALKLARFVPHGELEEEELRAVLTEAARSVGLEESEIRATLHSAIRYGKKEPADPGRHSEEPPGVKSKQLSSPELDWKPRIDLPPKLPPVPTMPPEMLPEVLRGWLVNAAELACIPLELFAVPAVAALSSLLGRSVKIKPERLQSWAVVPNLWGAIVGRPGTMKSMILDTAMEPLQHLERQAAKAYENQLLDVEIEHELLQAEIAASKKQMAKSGSFDREALRALKEREKENMATAKRYITQNVTYEKLGELIQENPRGLAFTRDELGSWLDDITREERAEARGFFLTAWNGEGAYAFERIGRGTVRADNPCISVIGGIQPGPLTSFIARSRAGSAGDSGLLQRFQLLVWPDSLGEWVRHTGQIPSEEKARAFSIFETLDTLYCPGDPPVLAFSNEAQPIWEEWRDGLENRLRGKQLELAPAFESHVSKYRSLAPSLALIFHLLTVATPALAAQQLPPVSLEALDLALNWVDFLELHARKVYALELGTSNAPAYALDEKIRAKHVRDGDKLRDLRRKEWAGLTDRLLDRAVEQLIGLGWVQVQQVETGGRSSEVLRLHPELIGSEE